MAIFYSFRRFRIVKSNSMRVQNAVFLMVLYCLTLSSLGQETDKVKKEINLKMGLFNYFNENYPSLNLGAEFFFSKPFFAI